MAEPCDEKLVLVYMTARDADEAGRIGRALVEERLAACVNVLGPIHAAYVWKGALQREGEVAFLAKTRRSLLDRLVERVRALHSYECPCVVALDIEGGHAPFLEWIRAQTSPS